ncbi:fimbrial protein [Rahnella laticis]|uniref:fimbrial protein n=1 Tax=Rahnella laticis TaxID=2787622 RepID=UPI0018A26593|nr:fimbrial protein [Rahnella laticis]MBF7993688.1 fimbrial protein [Rahnella laticis]
MTRFISIYSFIYLILGVSSISSYADVGMKLTGTLISPPTCTVTSTGPDGGDMIDINFSDRVGINKIDGVNYIQPVNYQIVCNPFSSSWDAKISVTGIATGFDPAAVQTNFSDLGIRLMQNGLPFELNKPVSIDPEHPPALTAVPVKAVNADLPEGEFIATATLLVQYQ